MTDVMLDFETLGTGPNAAVIQIGACYFSPTSGEIGKTLKLNIDLRSAQQSGGEIDADTVLFWLKQSEAARNSITAEGQLGIGEAFTQLNDFLCGASNIWSHATFDFVILTQTVKRLGIKPRFSYRTSRDIRTLMCLSGYKGNGNRKGVHHDALDDCIYQVEYCSAAIRMLY